jgi:hypothetical protein
MRLGANERSMNCSINQLLNELCHAPADMARIVGWRVMPFVAAEATAATSGVVALIVRRGP